MRIGSNPTAEAGGCSGRTGTLALAFAILALPALPAFAGSASASLAVSVVVLPRALLSVESQPASLPITEEDVTRGYVEISGATRIQVRTNSPAGWLLDFQMTPGPWRSLEVSGLGSPVQVSGTGGWLAQPYTGKTLVSAELGYRFVLLDGAQPGTYAWPLTLSAIPR